ncbi:plasmid mobilization relaxosome protein MobC [Draconibacterium orientale]|uniref:plasmid mobilization protein n=1 Tax=Draconibacterium orientale TaxID=1168034 RepID=UPI002A0A4502|nr:plasmid mobilization relaxosome protein MobC [Draconibacterium orientale]
MSRPRNPRVKKTDSISIRFTALEKKLLCDRCEKEGYKNLSNFFRVKVMRHREVKKIEVSPEFTTLIKSLDFNLNKIGVNLNQVAKQLNTKKNNELTLADRHTLDRVQQELKKCFSSLQKYMDLIR